MGIGILNSSANNELVIGCKRARANVDKKLRFFEAPSKGHKKQRHTVLRVLLLGLEKQIHGRQPLDHPAVAWLISHEAHVRNLRVVGPGLFMEIRIFLCSLFDGPRG